MSDLIKFYKEFLQQDFEGVHILEDNHTLKLCYQSHFIPGSVLRYVVLNCPKSCNYFVATCVWSEQLYLCVHDD